MNPSNRRIRKPKLPPDVMEALGEEPSVDGLAGLDAEGEGAADPIADAPDVAVAPPRKAPPRRSEGRVATALRHVGGFVLVVCVSVAVAWAARRYVTESPRFAVVKVDVEGNGFRTSQQLIEAAGVVMGQNVFAFDLDEARARVLRDPWIREATLSRRLPGSLTLRVAEREAVALVALGELYLSTREGEIFKRLEPGDPSDFPVITGIDADAVAEDRDGVAQSIRRALDLAGDYEQLPLGQKQKLQEIHLAKDGATTLIVGKAGLQLALGDPPFRKKLDQAARVVAELEKRGAKADAIMLDNDARPERVVVRVR